jgi:phage-related protein
MADTWAVVNGAVKNAAPKVSNAVSNLPNQISSKVPAGIVATIGDGIGQVDAKLAKAAAALDVPPVTNPAAFVEGIGWMEKAKPSTKDVQNAKLQKKNSKTTTSTKAGTTDASNPEAIRTQILDPAKTGVELIVDSFLQGLQGGLSSILGQGLNNLLGSLPSAMQNLLSSTGLTGALGQALGKIDGAIGNALNGLSNALGDAAGKIAGDLGAAISNIPGVGPVFEGFTKGLGKFTDNLKGAVNGLPTELQGVLAGAAKGIGANLVGKALGKANIAQNIGKQITKQISFPENPATLANNLANAATALNNRTYKSTGDKIFSQVAQSAKKVAKKFNTKLIKKKDWQISTQIFPEAPKVEAVIEGIILTPTELEKLRRNGLILSG